MAGAGNGVVGPGPGAARLDETFGVPGAFDRVRIGPESDTERGDENNEPEDRFS